MNALSLEIASMSYSLNGGPNLLESIKLNFDPGTVSAILGPSGAGKTTMLRIIAGLEDKYEGSVYLGNSIILKPTRRIQLVFQDNRIIPWKTVRGNLLFALGSVEKNASSNEKKIMEWLRTIGLADRSSSWPKTLSGGEIARLALARALIASPEILLLDEPFRNLDLPVKLGLLRTVEEQAIDHSKTVVIVTHSPEDALLISDRILFFDRNPMRQPEIWNIGLPRPRLPGDVDVVKEIARVAGRLCSPFASGESRP